MKFLIWTTEKKLIEYLLKMNGNEIILNLITNKKIPIISLWTALIVSYLQIIVIHLI